MQTMLRRLLPALVLVAWLAGAGPLGQFAGKLGDVQTNDSSAFLPAGAESTRVAELRRGFEETGAVPAVIVWESGGAIGAEQRTAAAGAVRSIAGLGVTQGQASPPLPSDNGRALQAIVPLKPDLAEPGEAIDKLREAAGAVPGAQVHVAGPAATQADLSGAFAGIDGLLLLVALGVVLLILLGVYRSVLLPVVVILGAVLALGLASALVYVLADRGVLALDGQAQGIMFILVVGAATDYSLLLAIRFREELAAGDDRWTAIKVAWRRSLTPIAASAFTVAAGLLTLLFSDLNSNRSLGPVATIGVVCALLSALTFLPAALALLGRAAYWPARNLGRGQALWTRIAGLVRRRPRRVWAVTALVLAGCALCMPLLQADGIPRSEVFIGDKPSVAGQQALARNFAAGSGSPAVVIAPAAAAEKITATVRDTPGVAQVRPPGKVVDGRVEITATLAAPPDSDAALDTVARLRTALNGTDALVGGYTATQYDTLRTAERDRTIIIPIALAVILLILALLLRALTASVLLIATVALSFAATLGLSALAFNWVFDFPGADPTVPLFGFVFLVALGVDYNIFLMTRVREESARHGTREGVLRGLVATGGVITSAGVVLAATFGALSVIPLVFLVELSFIVALGVLLDTLAVRSLLVPALVYDIGDRIWWPGSPAPAEPPAPAPADDLELSAHRPS